MIISDTKYKVLIVSSVARHYIRVSVKELLLKSAYGRQSMNKIGLEIGGWRNKTMKHLSSKRNDFTTCQIRVKLFYDFHETLPISLENFKNFIKNSMKNGPSNSEQFSIKA